MHMLVLCTSLCLQSPSSSSLIYIPLPPSPLPPSPSCSASHSPEPRVKFNSLRATPKSSLFISLKTAVLPSSSLPLMRVGSVGVCESVVAGGNTVSSAEVEPATDRDHAPTSCCSVCCETTKDGVSRRLLVEASLYSANVEVVVPAADEVALDVASKDLPHFPLEEATLDRVEASSLTTGEPTAAEAAEFGLRLKRGGVMFFFDLRLRLPLAACWTSPLPAPPRGGVDWPLPLAPPACCRCCCCLPGGVDIPT